jgi:hypothetical protein
MQSVQNLKENIFSDCQKILQELGKIKSQEDLLKGNHAISLFFEQALLLKKLSEIEIDIQPENKDFLDDNKLEIEGLKASNETLKKEYWEILQQKEEQITLLLARIKVLENAEVQHNFKENETITPKASLENVFAKVTENEIPNTESLNLNSKEEIGTLEEQIKALQDKDSVERKIVEFNIEHPNLKPIPVFEEFKSETASEKKFRLGKIKGLNIIKSLFDDDFIEEEGPKSTETHSLHKSNMATDFMEAEKQKIDFRIDLNDKLAFTKLLFKGDEDALRATINQLNRYKTLDEAKEYLSELYYTKDWKKVDDYAQRLWVLVENKFI